MSGLFCWCDHPQMDQAGKFCMKCRERLIDTPAPVTEPAGETDDSGDCSLCGGRAPSPYCSAAHPEWDRLERALTAAQAKIAELEATVAQIQLTK